MCLANVNARDQLRAPYNRRLGYPGMCLATFVIAVQVSDVIRVLPSAQLDAMASALRRSYSQRSALPALLGTSAAILHPLVDAARAGT
jgi:hypothetical protein